jgi:hypothetical protein
MAAGGGISQSSGDYRRKIIRITSQEAEGEGDLLATGYRRRRALTEAEEQLGCLWTEFIETCAQLPHQGQDGRGVYIRV